MASKALNQSMRDRLRSNLLAKRFDAEEDRLKKRENELAEKAWKKLVGHKNITKLQSLPDGWLPTTSIIKVDYGYSFTTIELEQARPVPASKRGSAIKEERDSALAKSIRELRDQQEKLKDERRQLSTQIKAALRQFNTTKQLREGWPEAAEYLPADSQEKRVPMVPVERLNAALGLQAA